MARAGDAGTSLVFGYQGTSDADRGNGPREHLRLDGRGPGGVVACRSQSIVGGRLDESNLIFGDQYKWSTDTPTSTDGMVVEAVALQELGHADELRDLYGDQHKSKAVCGSAANGPTKRRLRVGDTTGLHWIHATPATVRLTDVETIRRTDGTLLRFPQPDPRPLLGFDVHARSAGEFAKVGDVPYSFGCVSYEHLDSEHRARPSDCAVTDATPTRECQERFRPLPALPRLRIGIMPSIARRPRTRSGAGRALRPPTTGHARAEPWSRHVRSRGRGGTACGADHPGAGHGRGQSGSEAAAAESRFCPSNHTDRCKACPLHSHWRPGVMQ